MTFDLFHKSLDLPPDKSIITDEQAMLLAIQEGYKGTGFVSPNPLVGCVILSKKNEFLSIGYHHKVGEAHAEINALDNFQEKVSNQPSLFKADDLIDARVFVTLEPCAHQGRTGSCAKKLSVLPIKEVIYCLKDPNPLVMGKGKAIIVESNKSVSCIEEENPNSHLVLFAKNLCEHFLHNFERQKIFFSLKIATSLDGMLAMKSGESKWITGPAAREYSHFLRFSHDAILIGSNTIIADNPSLDIRMTNPGQFNISNHIVPLKKNKIVIIDPQAKILSNLSHFKISKIHDSNNLIFLVSRKFNENSFDLNKINCKVIFFDDISLDLKFLDQQLWKLGIRSVLVEGGAHTLSQFLVQKTGQRLYLFQAPILLGGINGKLWSETLSIDSLKDQIVVKNQLFKRLDPDFLITGKLNF